MEIVDRGTFEAFLDRLRSREKAHTREGDAIAAARRRLPAVEVDATLPLLGPAGPVTLLDAFEGRRQLIAYYFMWNPGRPAAEQCEGCTFYASQVAELSPLHSRDITGTAMFSQGRNVSTEPADARTSYEESLRYRAFMDWRMPWYSAQPSLRGAAVRARDRVVPPGLLRARRRPRVRDVLDETPRRGGDGLQLRADGFDAVRPPGVLGGLTGGLAPGEARTSEPKRARPSGRR